MQLGHVIEAGLRWTVFTFSPQDDTPLRTLCDRLENDPQSPLQKYRRDGDGIEDTDRHPRGLSARLP